jgi:hypothetical protein
MFKYKTAFYYDRGLKIRIDDDIRRLYFWHLYRSGESTLGLALPSGRGHVSVTLPKHHGRDVCQCSKVYAGMPVTLEIHNEVIYKGGSWFTNYYIKVECELADKLKRTCGIKQNPFKFLRWKWLNKIMGKLGYETFLGYHITIANDKHFINNSNPKLKEVTIQYNNGELTNSEYRQKMVDIVANKDTIC